MSLPSYIPIKTGSVSSAQPRMFTGLPMQQQQQPPFSGGSANLISRPEDTIPKPATTMYVGKIPENFEDKFVRKLLEQCGPVRNLQRGKDAITLVPKRFGFCEYEAPDSVEVALSAFKGVAFKNGPDGKEEELIVKCDDKTMKTVHDYIEKIKEAGRKEKIASEYKRIEALPPGVPEKTAPVDEAKFAAISDEEFQKEFERRIRVAKQCIHMIAKDRAGPAEGASNDTGDGTKDKKNGKEKKKNDNHTEEIKAWRERAAKKDAEAMKKMLNHEEDIKRDAERDERRERSKMLERLKRDLKSYEHDISILDGDAFKDYEKHYEVREADRIKKWKREEEDFYEMRGKRHDKILSEKERKRERDEDTEDREREEREAKRRKEEEAAVERKRAAEEERRRKEIEEEQRMAAVNMDLNLGSAKKAHEERKPTDSRVAENEDGEESDEDDSFGLKHQKRMREEINKKIMDMVPSDKDELFGFQVDWSVVSRYKVIEEKIQPWVVKKVVDFLGEEEPTLISFIVGEFKARPTPEDLVKKLEGALGEEAIEFVVQGWKLLVFETLSATYNKKINYIN